MPTTDRQLEQAERRQRLRERAAALNLSGVLVFSRRRATLGWFCGYTPGYLSNSGWLWVPVDGEDVLGVGFPFDAERATEVSGLRVVSDGSPAETIERRAGAAWGLVAADLGVDETPAALFQAMGPGGHFVDLHTDVAAWRAVKAPHEVARLRGLAVIAADALRECPDVVGLDDFVIAAAIEAAVRRRGAERVLCLLGVGDGAVVTEAHGRRVGEEDVVCVELTFYGNGGCMHVNTTIGAASPTPEHRRALAVCRRTRQSLIDGMLPGASIEDIVCTGDSVLADSGMLAIKEYDFGHGLGPDTPEHPRLVAGAGGAVAEGMVVAVHVALRGMDGHTAFVGGPVVVGNHGAVELADDAPWSAECGSDRPPNPQQRPQDALA